MPLRILGVARPRFLLASTWVHHSQGIVDCWHSNLQHLLLGFHAGLRAVFKQFWVRQHHWPEHSYGLMAGYPDNMRITVWDRLYILHVRRRYLSAAHVVQSQQDMRVPVMTEHCQPQIA